MGVRALTDTELAQFDSGLKALVVSPRIQAAATATAATADLGNEFCTIWPKAEPILKIVAKYVVFIPGVGAIAGEVLTALIAALDALAGQVCPKT